MLLSLSIKNYALIDDLEMRFSPGFTVITGETGAGKSILLGALSLLLGKRADTSVLADTGRKCVVEGSFAVTVIIRSPPMASMFLFRSSSIARMNETLTRSAAMPRKIPNAVINERVLLENSSRRQRLRFTKNTAAVRRGFTAPLSRQQD